MSATLALVILSWIVIILLSFAMSALLREVRALSAKVNRTGELPGASMGLPIGSPAPRLGRLDGGGVGGVTLLFVSRTCVSCHALLEEVTARWRGRSGSLHVFCDGELPTVADSLPPAVVRHDNAARWFEAFDVPVTPFFTEVGADGLVARAAPALELDDIYPDGAGHLGSTHAS